MAKEFSRSQRVGEQIRRELADLLQFEVKDPRVGRVTLTEVEVAGDLSHAKVYFVLQENADDVTDVLNGISGFLRRQLSTRLLLRTVPQLHFVYDVSLDRGIHLSKLIDQATKS